jgi:hypothetical protein
MTVLSKRRFRVRYSLRALLVATLLASATLGLWVNSAMKQRRAVEGILKAGGVIEYDHGGQEHDSPYFGRENRGHSWSNDYFSRVVGVDFKDLSAWTVSNDVTGEVWHPKTITDKDLVLIKSLARLEGLSLRDASITDVGLENLKNLSNLKELELQGTRITDAGNDHLLGLNRLESLSLANTKVTDRGIERLGSLNQLEYLTLDGTAITREGVEQLRKSLPNCLITHDFGLSISAQHDEDCP